jgi:hypothetical protein
MMKDTMILAYLTDCGFPEKKKEQYVSLCSQGKTEQQLRMLKMQRINLLDDLHQSQVRIDRIDYLIDGLSDRIETNNKERDKG